MSERHLDWPIVNLGAESVNRLRAVRIQVSARRTLDVVDLMRAWRAHVEKLGHDMSHPVLDRSVWGAYDLIAAYLIRDFLESALDGLPADECAAMRSLLAEVDDSFARDTENDDDFRAAGLNERDPRRCGWWWGRIPVRGPVRDDLIALTGGLA